ncbi:MAG: L,D-transpeptidase [Verrucomicrobiota bacterium]|nr:L,D-transpeptidase [Verrucomicrobiota bacterium]
MKFFGTVTFALALIASTQAAPRPRAASSPTFHWPWEKPAPTPIPAPTPKPKPTPIPRAIAAPTPVITLPNYDEETSTRLQIFLDNHLFAPGKIDGAMGEFFRKALVSYKRANGMPVNGSVDVLLAGVPQAFTNYIIPPEAENFVGAVSSQPSEQAKLKALKYGSLLEFVAERFHAEEAFLKKLNRTQNLEKLRPGDIVLVPNVQPFEIEKLSEAFVPPNPAFATRKLYVDTRERTLVIKDGDKIVAHFPITPGSTKLPAPIGTWKILGIATLPWFRHDEGVLNFGVRTENFFNLPPGPNNPVGILWMGLNKPGIGIHGTNNPETIGRAGSHGCIRTANWDAARIKDLVTVNNVVEIF